MEWSSPTPTRWWLLALTLCCLGLLLNPVDAAKKQASAKEEAAQKIEEATSKQLEKILHDKDYVAVFWCKFLTKIT